MYQFVSAFNKRLLLAAAVALPSMSALAQQAPAVSAEPLQGIIVTGSRIAAPNEVSTSPIQVLSSKYIETTGKTDISDLILQLPQIMNNSLGQDLGNTTSGLTTAGGIATADLRGLGPNRTLVLVDGRRLGQGSPYTFIQSPAPDLDQIPGGLVERIEVVTGGASAVYGSDAIAGVINFIMKKNFEGIQIDSQWGVDQHSNHNDYMQNIATQDGFPTNTSSVHDGQSKMFSLLMGTNVADGKGNITAYLEYRHANPIYAPARDFAACELVNNSDDAGNVLPNICIGTRNSNHFGVGDNVYSVVGNQLLPYPQAGSSPPPQFNSNQFITLSREDQRYNAGFMAHITINEHVRPYMDFGFMS